MEKPRVLCAIDFGTTFSGFAFCSNAEDDAKIFQWCGSEMRQRALRATPRERVRAHAPCADTRSATLSRAPCCMIRRARSLAASGPYLLCLDRYDWPDQLQGGGMPYCKTRTELLLDAGSGAVRAWGWSALTGHLTASAAAARATAHGEAPPAPPVFLSRFKLHLAPGAAPPLNGHSARSLVAKYLTALGALAIEHIRRQLGDHIRPTDIQWCLTVRRACCDHVRGGQLR